MWGRALEQAVEGKEASHMAGGRAKGRETLEGWLDGFRPTAWVISRIAAVAPPACLRFPNSGWLAGPEPSAPFVRTSPRGRA